MHVSQEQSFDPKIENLVKIEILAKKTKMTKIKMNKLKN